MGWYRDFVQNPFKTILNRLFKSRPRNTASRSKNPAKPRIGLALSSGGAKGLAHIGALQVFEENDIHIDVVTGSSMGALIAACWGHGMTGNDMEDFAREYEGPWSWLRLIDPVIFPRRGFIKGRRVRNILAEKIHNTSFEDLERPIRIITTRLDTFERTIFESGDVADAVHASIAIPGVCQPVKLDGIPYVDGGIVDPVPIGPLKEMNVDLIIAIKVIPDSEVVKSWILKGEPGRGEIKDRNAKGIGAWFNRHFNYFAYGNILNTMMRSIHAAQIRIAEKSCLNADIVLKPVIPEGVWTDFSSPDKYIRVGREAATAGLDEIKKLISEFSEQGTINQGSNHEPSDQRSLAQTH
ncbi:MAG: patatin-like phospholipase family protein [Verrucomicrobiota bacterium]